jgi:hypothetical protein
MHGRAEIYTQVVIEWCPVKEVAEAFHRGPPSIDQTVRREFNSRHPWAYAKMCSVMEANPCRAEWSAPVPYLWMLRAYERWRAIPKKGSCISEAWSRIYDPAQLLRRWQEANATEEKAA